MDETPPYLLQIKITKDNYTYQVKFEGDKVAFNIGNSEANDGNLINERRFLGIQFMVVQKNLDYFLKDCGQIVHMVTKLDQKRPVKLYPGAVFDLGNDVRYHISKCFNPT